MDPKKDHLIHNKGQPSHREPASAPIREKSHKRRRRLVAPRNPEGDEDANDVFDISLFQHDRKGGDISRFMEYEPATYLANKELREKQADRELEVEIQIEFLRELNNRISPLQSWILGLRLLFNLNPKEIGEVIDRHERTVYYHLVKIQRHAEKLMSERKKKRDDID